MIEMQQLLEELNISAPAGVTEAKLSAFEADTGLPLPESVRAFYAAADGAVLNAKWLQLLSLEEAKTYLEMIRTAGYTQQWGYLPLTENHDSNFFCVCCRAPLTDYVVYVPHDDSAQVKFRSVGAFLTALGEFVGQDEWDLYDLPSDFDAPERTEADVIIGRELLEVAKGLEAEERQDAIRFGVRLLSEAQVDEITPLLEHDDTYVQQDTRERLAAMQSPIAADALARDAADFRQFVTDGALFLSRKGVQATVVDEVNIRLDPGPVWLNMRTFYARRRSDGFDFLKQRAQVFLAPHVKSENVVSPPPPLADPQTFPPALALVARRRKAP